MSTNFYCRTCDDPAGPHYGLELAEGSGFFLCLKCWDSLGVMDRAKLRVDVANMVTGKIMADACDALARLREAEQEPREEWRDSL